MAWVYRAYLHLHGDQPLNLGKLHVTVEQQIIFLIGLVGAILTVASIRWMIGHLLGPGSPYRWVSLASIYMLSTHELLVTDIRTQFPYDLMTAVFFGTGMFAALLRKRWLYYLMFLVGTLNRETTMFLPLVFLMAAIPVDRPLKEAWKSVRPAVVIEVLLQLAVWKGIVSFCERITGGHGTGMEIHWKSNLFMLANPRHLPLFLSVFGFLWVPVLIYQKRISHPTLRRCLLLLLGWFLVMFYVGDFLEIRLMNEWVPFMTVCLALILKNSIRLVGQPPQDADQEMAAAAS